MALFALGQESELLYFTQKAKARRPGATYPAPTKQTANPGRYYLSVDAEDWPVLGSLFTVSTAAQAAGS